ncbi:MAG: HlyD family efflux transporter periplasmic adaptor subunit [Desulfovibrio sp.]|nr:MAG: HlyD family efflux transporter periplasmic adaptor subunit [Desulfovibrio sp.]
MNRYVSLLLLSLLCLLPLASCSEQDQSLHQGWVEGDYVYIAAPLAGRLQELAVDKGQTIEENVLLFQLERSREQAAVNEAEQRLAQARARLDDLAKGGRPSELAAIEARLEQAQTTRDLARNEYLRRVDLYEEQSISTEELDRARAEYNRANQQVAQIQAELDTAGLGGREDAVAAAQAEVAAIEAQLAQAQWNFDQKTQNAPVAGLVFDTYYDPGEWVPAGTPVLSILPPDNVFIRFFVPQEIASTLAPGQALSVLVDGLGTVEASVTWISNQVEYTPPVIYSSRSRAKLVVMVEAEPHEAWRTALHPGQPVDVRLP